MGALGLPFENLPLGFRFKPTDVELIDHYLRLKINGKENEVACIKEVDICRVEPWDLPDLSAIKTYDHEWFFFCPRDRKYPNGQRSNRATEAGYWKATGKDRTIKSRKMGLMGMKKTLVFYMGRAPKGQRTNWVIHEYRTTLQELDGSHPGQGAFVLCRLFKKADDLKPDENDDGSHTEEVETNICSPNPTIISQEDIRSEPAVVQASPVSVEHSVEQQMMSENCVVKPADSITSETMYPDRTQANVEMMHEVDSQVNDIFCYDPPEQYYKWQTVPMAGNQGPGGIDELFRADIGDDHDGLHFQDKKGRDPISDFLDSVLINPDAPFCEEADRQGASTVESDMWRKSYIKESGSCSGSDVEVAQLQHDVGYNSRITSDENYYEPNGNKELIQKHTFADDDDIFSEASLDRFLNIPSMKAEDDNQIVGNNGIILRSHSRMRGRQFQFPNFSEQGTAPRRLLMSKVEENDSESTVTESSPAALDWSTTIPPSEDMFCLADLGDHTAAQKSEVAETGIKIRSRTQRSRPDASKFVKQGTADRRIRLQMHSSFKTEEVLVAEVGNVSEIVSEKRWAGNSDEGSNQKCRSFKRSMAVNMNKVVMVVFLFMACFGLWIVRNVFILSS